MRVVAQRSVPDEDPERDWSRRLDAVLADGGVRAHHQPIVDLARGVVVGYEALARFTVPGDGPARRPAPVPVLGVEPWFHAARRLGRLPELEAAALAAALRRAHERPVNTFLTVNLGPDVLDHPAVREVLAGEGSLSGIVVELTEHARVEDYRALEPALDRLRGAGAMLAIDDAGSGYAGLQHLITLRPDIIKLDRALISGVDHDEVKRALVDMIGTFASRVDAWILAEGVETRPELETLSRLGVPLAQGYYLGRPGDGWPQMDEVTTAHVRAARGRPDRGGPTLRSLLEQAPTTTDPLVDTPAGAPGEHDLTVLVDQHTRPLAVLGRVGGELAVHHSVLPVNVDTPVSQAAHRALTRADGQRFRPLVCTDDAGHFVGLVRMERVVDRLATSLAAVPVEPVVDLGG